MGLIWLALGAIAVWALIRLGRETERAGRRHWRVAATLLSAVLIAGGVLAGARGGWLLSAGLTGAGLWLSMGARIPGVERSGPRRPAASAEPLSVAEARAILGVSKTADAVEINAAWRRLMGRAHPDQGGTEGLAAQLNAARDRLLQKG